MQMPRKPRNEINLSVENHLRKRKYVSADRMRRVDFTQQHNKKQFLLHKLLELDVGVGNNFIFSNVLCLTNNSHIVDQQFARFCQFIESQNDFLRVELRRFYAPVICHLFLELLRSREQKAAQDFLRKYAELIAPVDFYEQPLPNKINGCPVNEGHHRIGNIGGAVNALPQQASLRFRRDANLFNDPDLDFFMKFVQLLSVCAKPEVIESQPEIRQFRSSKYEIHTLEAVIDTLNVFLKCRGHVLILSLLYTWVHVHIIDNELRKWSEDSIFLVGFEEEEEEISKFAKPRYYESTERRKHPPDKATIEMFTNREEEINIAESKRMELKNEMQKNVYQHLRIIDETREQFSKVQTDFPCVIKVADKSRGLLAAHLDTNECHFIAGFNSSAISLYQLNQQLCMGKNLYRSATERTCPWELNNCYAEEEDEIDLEIKELESNRKTADSITKRKFYETKYADNSYNEYSGIQLRGHNAGVTGLQFSRHLPLIFSISKDTTLRAWKADSYRCTAVYSGHNYPIWCLDESPTGQFLATGSKDNTARLWCLNRKYPFMTYIGHTQDVECLSFHPNGNYLATGSTDFSVRLWNVPNGNMVRVFSDCKYPVTCIAFSPDGKLIAAGGEESIVRIYDIAGGQQMAELRAHPACVTSLAWNTNGRHIATGCSDGSLRIFDIKKFTMHDSSYPSSSNSLASSSSPSPACVLSINTDCQRLVKILYKLDNSVCCIGV